MAWRCRFLTIRRASTPTLARSRARESPRLQVRNPVAAPWSHAAAPSAPAAAATAAGAGRGPARGHAQARAAKTGHPRSRQTRKRPCSSQQAPPPAKLQRIVSGEAAPDPKAALDNRRRRARPLMEALPRTARAARPPGHEALRQVAEGGACRGPPSCKMAEDGLDASLLDKDRTRRPTRRL